MAKPDIHGGIGKWGNREVGKWGNGEIGKWENGELGKWENGKMGKWENGEMGKWGNGKEQTQSVTSHQSLVTSRRSPVVRNQK